MHKKKKNELFILKNLHTYKFTFLFLINFDLKIQYDYYTLVFDYKINFQIYLKQ